MTIVLLYSPEFLQHDTGSFHPENPGRLSAIVHALDHLPWNDQLEWRLPSPVSQRDPLPWIREVHHPEYVEAVQKLAAQGGGHIDGDTIVSSRSYDVALLAVNAWLEGVDVVLQEQKSAFAIARPPGHHATRNYGMGFCIFSNAAIAAHYALQQPGIDRVAILDWDVHHGNGTEAIVTHNPQIAYCSLHEYPFYPGTGKATERGQHNNILNIPLAAGSTLADYTPAFEQKILPFLKNFNPQLLIISAGYDATHADHLAHICLKPIDYQQFTQYCLEISPHLLLGLEGGYNYEALSDSVAYTLQALIQT
ncbi:MAG: histone deacetylase [Prochlorotrichaceae cyanobacterium]